MSFIEGEFTRAISFKRLGGPGFSTFVVPTESGNEQRNQNWANPRARYTAGVITPTTDSLGNTTVLLAFADALRNFFIAARGKANGFRFFDHIDYLATDQPVGATAVDGSYQLQKTYTYAGISYARPITKPITSAVVDFQGNVLNETVVVKDGSGVVLTATIDATTGIISGASGTPATASFQYHIPVRFDTDNFDLQVEDSGVADGNPIVSWNSLALVEVRPPNY